MTRNETDALMFGMVIAFGCFIVGGAIFLICVDMVIDYKRSIRRANNGVEKRKEKHDELHG